MARMPGLNGGFHSVPHFGRGRGSAVNLIVIHQFAGGSVPAVQNWLRDPRSRVSYHFGVGRDGHVRQWVDTNDTAWATGPVNGRSIAIGHESTNQAMTDAQMNATAAIVRWARGAHRGIPAARSGLSGHRQWMSTNCPGNPIFGQLDELQRRAGGAAPPPTPGPPPSGVPPFDGVVLMQPPIMRRDSVRVWQARVTARSDLPNLTVDGAYGPQSQAAARRVQEIARLAVDGRVGPNTWPATWTTGAGAIGGGGGAATGEAAELASVAFWGGGASPEVHRAFVRRGDRAVMYSRNGSAPYQVVNGVARAGAGVSIATSAQGHVEIDWVNNGGAVVRALLPPGGGRDNWTWLDLGWQA